MTRLADQAAVSFQLGFAGTAQADTALLPFQVGPAADQAGCQVLQLGQLDLQLALVALGALGEDVENQAGAVQHAHVQAFFQIALLGRRQGVIEDDDFNLLGQAGLGDLVGLAGTDEIGGVGAGALGGDGGDRFGAGRAGEQSQLFHAGVEIASAEVDAD